MTENPTTREDEPAPPSLEERVAAVCAKINQARPFPGGRFAAWWVPETSTVEVDVEWAADAVAEMCWKRIETTAPEKWFRVFQPSTYDRLEELAAELVAGPLGTARRAAMVASVGVEPKIATAVARTCGDEVRVVFCYPEQDVVGVQEILEAQGASLLEMRS